MNSHLISVMIFLPLLGALFQAFNRGAVARWTAFGASLAAGVLGVVLVVATSTAAQPGPHFSESFSWVSSYAINYDVSIDGLNALLVLLISILFPLIIASEWKQKVGGRGMHALFLVLQTAFLGAVCAQDLFLQFFFWGLSALPFYFLVGIWGGANREVASSRSIVAAGIGNALFLSALILVYYSVEPHSFSLRELATARLSSKTFEMGGLELSISTTAFVLISLGLAIRAPIWPLHGWFTQSAEEAPPSVFIALSAVGVPVATYLFIRLSYSLFPETLTQWAPVVVGVGIANLIVGGICAISQRGLKLLSAFLCISEVGMILIGIGSLNSAGVVGAIYQQLVLGLGLAGFGLFSGVVVDRVGHTNFLDESGKRVFGGVAASAPMAALVTGVVTASLLGFPGSGGFVGHALLVIGSFSIHPLIVVLSAFSLLLAAYYLFAMYKQVFLGKAMGGGGEAFADLGLRERAYLLPLVACLLFFGLYPKPWIELARPTVLSLLSIVK